MQKNNKGSALIIAMGLVMIIGLLAFTILEYIIPFSKEIKGIENSSNAYYQANSGIEEALYHVYERNNSGSINYMTEYGTGFLGIVSTSYNTYSSGKVLPNPGDGNSMYNFNWNTISQGNPIQLSIGHNLLDTNFKIAFRVPNLDKFGGNSAPEEFSGGTLPIINWQLLSDNDTLNASGSIIKGDNILDSSENFSNNNSISMWNKKGVNLSGEEKRFSDFYTNNCESGSGCVLKFSVVNELETTDNLILPFLEWKIDTGGENIPDRYTKIEASGKSYGYKKDLEIKVPSQTVNEAFDFTVFQ